ncbi:MAG: hypothetical protein QM764_20720 [Chitinophagaceae bacterium]
MGQDGFPEFTLHIVLATAPQHQEGRFSQSIIDTFFNRYRDEAKSFCRKKEDSDSYGKVQDIQVLYNPLKYYILGNYDLSYVTLIDNYKFAQKLFEPHADENGSDKEPFSTHTFQSFTGITHHTTEELTSFFYHNKKTEKPKRPYFMAICNLKLNNAFLVGNGKEFLLQVRNRTQELIAAKNKSGHAVDFLFLQSFSWFEISLLLFTDNPESVSETLKSLRGLSICSLEDPAKLVRDSLYFDIEEGHADLDKTDVFSDTHTYFGIHSDLVDLPLEDDYVKKFIAGNIPLKTEIEWQLKPGHMDMLTKVLEQWHKTHSEVFQFSPRFLLAGKSDYVLRKKNDFAWENASVIRLLVDQDTGREVFNHVRKLRTKVSFLDTVPKKKDKPRQVFNLQSSLQHLCISAVKIDELDGFLKALKVSRQIRSKILKIFSNYNNGIQDPILFPFFLDLTIFVNDLAVLIAAEFEKWQQHLVSFEVTDTQVNDLEKALMNRIQIFQEGYNIRMMNCYQFEDITDFDLDFNSSIQQLLSAYSSVTFELGNLFYPPYNYGPIVQLHLKDTVANYISINYYIHHLSSPEFVFATITKEILNFMESDHGNISGLYERFSKHLPELKETDIFLNSLIQNDAIDLTYLFNDIIRFIVTYNGDFNLFYHWFWSYNLQNTSLYDKRGMINEAHFQTELFRIFFIATFFGVDAKQLECPVPEFFTYWDRHAKTAREGVEAFIQFMDKKSMSKDFTRILCKITEDATAKAMQGVGELERKQDCNVLDRLLLLTKKYGLAFSGNLARLLQQKETVYELFSSGAGAEITSRNSLLYFQWRMYDYLSEICKRNKEKVLLVRRNWATGRPLKCFINCDQQEHLYAVDQTGGVFFDGVDEMKQYFKLSTKTLFEIWDYGFRMKKNFILSRLKS